MAGQVPVGDGQTAVDSLLTLMQKQMTEVVDYANAIAAKPTPSELDLMQLNAKITQWSTMVSISSSTIRTIEDTIKSVANR